MRSGLEVLLEERLDTLAGARVAFLCNHTAVDADYRHGIDRLLARGVDLVRLFGPEHGVRATAQDMETVEEVRDPVTGLPTVSLYGHDEDSLRPDPAHLADVDVLLYDIQDIGTRFYTYQATLGFCMEVAAATGTKVIVLDRPNPIGGLAVEGGIVRSGFESFVGTTPLAVRHGMTAGEIASWMARCRGVDCELEVVPVDGWRRGQWHDQTGLPWVYPSPNMPTLDTATVYPGMCLIEATNLSEGRGTTRPFHLVGAPWLDPQALVAEMERLAAAVDLKGVAFRPAAFVPGFQKHAGTPCTGMELHVTDREALDAFLLGQLVVQAARTVDPDHFDWRHEPYEFVTREPAIDLLCGGPDFRVALEAGEDLAPVRATWETEQQTFLAERAAVLMYPV